MASVQRTWRRAWCCEKPAWQSMASMNLLKGRKRPNSKVVNNFSVRRRNWTKQIAASIAALQILSGGLNSAYASTITIDGRTATQIDAKGNVTDISTTTVRGNNAFNSFKDFNVSNGDIVNLRFSTNNLLNFVSGGNQSNIDGILNGIKNGQLGGNVFFLNPKGMVVGKYGIVNVGTLTAVTPTQASIDNFLNNNLKMGVDPVTLMPVDWTSFNAGEWVKTIPLSSDGSIVIAGKVNAINDVSLRGAAVSNSGVIQTGAAFSGKSAEFDDIVNTNDLQYGTKIGVENGVVVISADKTAENTGTISTHSTSKDDKVAISASDVKLGGSILTGGASLEIEATNSITADSALLSTRQVKEDSTLASIKDGSAVGVDKAGNVSMKVNHTTFKDAANIDIKNTVIDTSGYNDTNNKRVAGSSGDVLVVASSQDELFAWAVTGPEAKVTVTNTSIKGNDVDIQAIAKNDSTKSATMDSLDNPENTASLDEFAKSQSSIGDTLVGALVPTLGNLRVGAVGTDVSAKATVTLDDKTKINADNDVKITTAASSTATSMLFSIVGGVNVGISDAEALTNINKGAEITAGGNVTISADTSNKVDISALPIPIVGGLTPLNFLVSVGYMKSQSTADVNAGAVINATGDLNVTANSTKSMSVSSSASAAGGYFSAGVAVSRSDVNSDANIAGKVKAANVNLTSKINALKDVTWAESSVGDGEPGTGLDLAVDWISNSFGVWVKDKLGLGKPPKSAPPTVGITGAVAVTVADDNATASITSTGTTTLSDGTTSVNNAVKSLGNITIDSDVIENMQSGAIAQQKQREENNVLNHPTDANKKAAGVSAAVIYGQYDHSSNAFIGDGAVVDAKKNISITSDVTVPFQKKDWASIKTYAYALKDGFMSSNLGLAQALFTSWAQSSATGDVGSGAASVDIMNYNNDSRAYIGKNAQINQDKTFNSDFSASNVNLAATTTVTTLDLSGMFKSVLDDAIKAARNPKSDLSSFINVFGNSSAGSGIGGSIQVTLEDNTTKAYIDSGTKVNANDIKVDANTAISNISLGEAGGKAAKIGFNGTVNVNTISDTTYAQIINAADMVALNNIAVNATDNIYNVNAAGGFTESGSVGVGVSIGYNGISRDTEASVSGNVTAGNDLDITATNTGGIVSASLAGSVTKDQAPDPKDAEDADPIQFVSILFDGPSPVDAFKAKFSKFTSALTLGGKGTEAKTGYSVAGNVSYNGITDITKAFIGDTSDTPGTSKVKSKNSDVKAINDSGIYALSGAVAVAANSDPSSKGIAGAFMLNNIKDTTSAFATNSMIEMTGTDADDLLSLVANNNSDILSLAASGGVAPSGSGVAGQVSINMTDNTTLAYLDNATLTIANDVALQATDDASIITVGGAVAYGGGYGFGASIAVNVMENTTQAYINDSGISGTSKNSDVVVNADEESEIRSVTAAVGASQSNMAAAFSTSGNYLGNTTNAYISESTKDKTGIKTLGSVAVTAADTALITSVAGSGALSADSVGFGASTSVLVLNDQVSAYIGDNVEVTARGQNDTASFYNTPVDAGKTGTLTAIDSGLTLSADSKELVQTIAAGGAASGSVGLAGSVAVNVLLPTSKAYIGKNATINGGDNSSAGASQDVSVTASDKTNAIALAGALAVGKSAGVGLGLATQVITTNTQAYIDAGSTVNASQDVLVKALSEEDVTSFAGGAAGGGDVGAAGSATVQVMTNTTDAHIGNTKNTSAATVTAGDTVAVTAEDNSASNLITGSAAYGGSAGVGLSINTDVITKNTKAYIGENSSVTGLGKGSGLRVDTGTFDVTYKDYSADDIFKTTVTNSKISDEALLKIRAAEAAKSTVKGVAVSASNQNTVRTLAVGASASGTVAATGSTGVNVFTNTTEAYIGKNANINQTGTANSSQSVLVAAGSDYFNLGIDGSAAIGTGGAGIGAGAGVGVVTNTTKAYVDEGAKVAAAKNIAVIANNQAKIITVAAALGASGEVGVAGALGANVITDETKAYIGSNAVVTAGNNLAVNAEDTTGVISVDGGAGIGLSTAGVGGSVNATVVTKDTAAYIGSGAAVDAEGKDTSDQLEVSSGKGTKKINGLSITAQSKEDMIDVVASGGGGLYAGVAGAVAVNVVTANTKAYIGENSKINANSALQTKEAGASQAVNISAFDDLDLVSVGGSAAGGAAGVSGAADIGVINTNTNAYVGNGALLNAKGDLSIDAFAAKDISSTSISVSGGGVGLAGGISVYVIGANATGEALAQLNSKQSDSQGDSNVQGYVDNQMHNERIANVLNSYDDSSIKGAGSSFSTAVGKTKVSDSLSTTKTVVPAGTSAFIGDNVQINKKYSDNTAITDTAAYKGNVDVKAIDRLVHNANTGSLAVGSESAGGGINIAVINNAADAHIGKSSLVTTAGNLTIGADVDQQVITVAAGMAGGGQDGVAANLSVKVLGENATAYIDEGTALDKTVISADNVAVLADNNTTVTSVVGTAGVGGNSGVGASLDTAVITQNTLAYVKGQTDITSDGITEIEARSTDDLISTAAGLGGGGSAGIAGAISGYSLESNTIANIAKGAVVLAQQNLWLDAESNTDLNLASGTVAASGAAGVGAGIGVAVVDKTTKAYIGTETKDANGNTIIDAADTSVTALGNGSLLSIYDGSFDVKYTDYVDSDANPVYVSKDNKDQGSSALSKKRTASKHESTIQGVAVTATNQDDIRTFAAGGAIAAGLAASLSGDVNVINNTTTAAIGNSAKINQDNNAGANAAQSVRVAAGNDLYHLGAAGSAVGGGGVGIGAGADVTVIDDHTLASVGQAAKVSAAKDVSVIAEDTQQLISVTANASVAGIAGVAGSVSVNSLTTGTKALVGNNAVIDAGNVLVDATDTTGTDMIAGSAGIGFNTTGGVGIGAAGSVGVNSIKKDTDANIGDGATVDALNNLSVNANSTETLYNVTVAGAAGNDFGIAGAISVESLDVDTHAGIGAAAKINTKNGKTSSASAAQDVNVAANDTATITAVDGSAAAGALGAAGGVDIGIIKNNTLADIGDNTTVNAKQDVTVTATSTKTGNSTALSAAGGLGAIAGGISVYSVGNGLEADQAAKLNTNKGSVGSYADDQAKSSNVTNILKNSKSDSLKGITNTVETERSNVAVSSSFEKTTQSKGTAAGIGAGAAITAGRDVKIKAADTVNLTIKAGAAAVGVVGLGAGVGIASVSDTVNAYVSSPAAGQNGTTISAANGLVDVAAVMKETATDSAYVGTGGIIAVDAAVAVLHDDSEVAASIGDGASITKANSLAVSTDDTRSLTATTFGAGIGGYVSAGASVATTDIGGSDKAYLGDNVVVGSDSSPISALDIKTTSTLTAKSEAEAVKGGIGLAASGSVANATVDTSSQAYTGKSVKAAAANMSVTANAHSQVSANAKGINAGAIAVGVSSAKANNNSSVDAHLGDNNTITGDASKGLTLTVDAEALLPSANTASSYAYAGASGGGLLGVNATKSEADNTSVVKSYIGNGTTINDALKAGAVNVTATNNTKQVAESTANTGGIIAAGANESSASSDSTTQAYLGDGVSVTGKSLKVTATGNDDNYAKATSGTGGLIAGAAATAKTQTQGLTESKIGSSTAATKEIITLDGGFTLSADHTSKFDAQTNTTMAAALGGSGAYAENTDIYATKSEVGDKAEVKATAIDITAANHTRKERPSGDTRDVVAGSGGVANGTAAKSQTTIKNDTEVNVGSGTALTMTGVRYSTNTLNLMALNDVIAHDSVKLDASGGIEIAKAVSTIDNSQNDALIDIGSGAKLDSVGNIKLAATLTADVESDTSVKTSGGAGAAQGQSASTVKGNNKITLESGTGAAEDQLTSMRADGNITLQAGTSKTSDGKTAINAIAYTDLWNKTAFPIETKPDADGYVYQEDIISIGNNAQLASVGDVNLLTQKGTPNVIGSGTGTDLYREVLAEVGSFFSNLFGGGDVSLEVHGGSTYSGGSAGVKVNGTVNVGIENKRYLTIKTDGTVDTANTSKDVTVTASNENLTNTMQAQITKLEAMIAALNGVLGNSVESGNKGKYDALTAQRQAKVDQQSYDTTLSQGYQATINNLQPQLDAEKAKADDKQDAALIASLTNQITAAATNKQAAVDDYNSLATEITAIQAQITALGTTSSNNSVDKTKVTNLIGAYQAEIAMLQSKLAAQGNTSSANVTVLTVDKEIRAQSGNINVTGDYLTGSGKLQAPGDVLISVINNSKDFLRTGPLTVLNEAGGHLYFNNANVTDMSGINSRSFGSSDTFNGSLLTSANSALPSVVVTNNYIPASSSELAPDIYIDGNITNLTGTVSITSLRGSIEVADGVAVVGNTINLSAGKDITIGYAEGVRNVAGDIKETWKNVTDAATATGASWSSGTKSLADLGITASESGKAYLAGNNIFVSGEYLNINGVIQSGIADHSVTVTQAEVDAAKTTATTGKVLVKTAATSALGDIAVYYNCDTGNLEAEATSVMGGYMELYGHILNTGYGELQVMDGYGKISIDNQSTSLLQVNTLNTGSGVQGTIKITDTAKKTSDGNATLVTVYKKAGDITNVYTNDNASHLLNLSTPDSKYNYSATNAVYSPLANQYYSWTVVKTDTWDQQRDCTEKHYFGISGGTSRDYGSPIDLASTTQTVDDDVIRVISGSTDKFILNHSYNVSETAPWKRVDGSYHDHDYLLYEKETWTDQRSLKAVTVNEYNVYAANPVKISWLGSSTGTVDIKSVGSVNLNGGITNKTGTTNITSGGAITKTAAAEGVTAQNLNFKAGTGVGTAATPIDVTMLAGGKLTADSTSGDISIKGLQGDIVFDKLNTTGNVYLSAENSLYGLDTNSLISGNLIELSAQHGKIGSSSSPLKIRAASNTSGGLDATAGDSIYITQTDGDLYLTQAVSTAGDVEITALNGSILDNNTVKSENAHTKAQLLSLWDDMQLTGEKAQASADNNVAAYEAQKTQEYRTYWQYRQKFTDASGNVLPYSSGQKIAFSANEKAYYKNTLGWTDEQISQRETQMTAQYQSLNTAYGSVSGSYKNDWKYTVLKPTDASGKTMYEGYDAQLFAEWNSLVAGSSWTVAQLTNSLSVGLMKETSDTRITVEAPNISGRNVILTATNGSIGSDGSTVDINISGRKWSDLTNTEKLAIMSAETKDTTVLSDKEIQITSREDINVEASGTVTAAATGNAYLGSEGTINLKQVKAGKDVRIKSRHGIVNATNDGTINVIGKDTILEAAQNSIGKTAGDNPVTNPLLIQIGTGNLTARSGGDIYIASPDNLNLDTVYAVYHADLTTSGDILNATLTDQNIRAESLTLTANNGSIGTNGKYLKVGLDATGELVVDAKGDIYIASPKRDISISKITSAEGSVGLIGGGSISIDQGGINAALDATVSTGNSISVTGYDPSAQRITAENIYLLATNGSIGSAENSLGIQAAGIGTVTAAAGKNVYLTQLSGNLNASDVTAGSGDINLLVKSGNAALGVLAAAGGNVTVAASGSIENTASSPGTTNITAKGITLTAQNGGIGTAAKHLTIDSSNASNGTVSASAKEGIYLNEISGDLKVNNISSANGNLDIAADGSILNGRDDNGINLQGASIALTSSHGGIGKIGKRLVTALAPTGKFNFAPNILNGDFSMEVRSGDFNYDNSAGALTSNGAIDLLVTSGKADVKTFNANGDIKLDVHDSLTSTAIASSNGSVSIKTGKDAKVGSVNASNDILITVNTGNLTAASITSSKGGIGMVVGGNANTIALNAEGGISGTVSGDFTTNTMNSRNGSILLSSGGKVSGNSAAAFDTIDITAKDGTDIKKLTAGTMKFAITAPDGEINLGEVNVGKKLSVAADSVVLSNVVHTGNTSLLVMDITGGSKPMANSVVVNVASVPGVQFDHLNADRASITANTEKLEMHNNNIGSRADVRNNYYHVVTDSKPRTLFDGDVVLYPIDGGYDLIMDGKIINTDTTILNSRSGIMLNGSPNPETAVTTAENVSRNASGIKGSDIWQEGNIERNRENTMGTGIVNPADLVDTTQLMIQQTGNPISVDTQEQESK